MTERAIEIIEMLQIIKNNSHYGLTEASKDFTTIDDCKKESFDFVIDQAVSYIIDQEGGQ